MAVHPFGEIRSGVLCDREANTKDADHRLDASSWNMPALFSVLSGARGIIEFGDPFLIPLTAFLLIAVRLAAPFMVAAAVDRHYTLRSGVVLPLGGGTE